SVCNPKYTADYLFYFWSPRENEISILYICLVFTLLGTLVKYLSSCADHSRIGRLEIGLRIGTTILEFRGIRDKRNLRLRSIAENIRSTHPEQEEAGIPCTYCDSPVPAAKTCLHCEASLCDKHLKKHSKSAEHVLTEPTTSLENRKCSVHKKVLEYYCCEDAACICVSCRLDGEHRGHQVETLNEASEKKKEKLRNILQKLTSQREEAEKRVQSLEELRRQVQGKAAGVTERVTALIRDIRKQLEALEKRVLSEISRQEEQVSLRVSDLIRQLEIKKEELSRKMGDIEELCDMTDPVTVLQGRESDRDDYCDIEELCDMTDPVTVLHGRESDRDGYCDAAKNGGKDERKCIYGRM
uniref:B box-type domain-containing protein n=1 Tax=Leptobrachium leishanense TaxID=445787 RepID=A0A8C5PWM7_9ANUR